MQEISPELLALATPEELAAYETALNLSLALSCPAEYARHCWNGFLEPPHLALLNQTFMDLIEGRLLRADGTPYTKLLVTMPPRHGKSEFISKYTPAWFLTTHPELKVILASYEADFAASWGRQVRNTITEHPELGIEIDPTSKAANQFSIKGHRGGMATAGAGGAITGRGANLLIIDDPVKNSQDAASATLRDTNYEWATGTAFTRLEPPLKITILLQTRWHDDDLAGRMLRLHGDEWYHFDFPAVARDDDVLGRAPGEALWPERFPVEALEEIRKGMPSFQWASLYQQSPMIDGGNIFRLDTFRYFTVDDEEYVLHYADKPDKRVPIRKCFRFQTVDLAVTVKNTSDYTVVLTCAQTPDKDMLVLDVHRVRIEGADHERLLKQQALKWNPRFQGVEKATFGITLLQAMRRKGLPIRELKADKDKVTRSFPAVALIENQRCFFRAAAPWLAEFERELLIFDKGAHDDQVDCIAYAAKEVMRFDRKHRPGVDPEKTGLQATVDAHLRNFRRKRRPIHPTLGRM